MSANMQRDDGLAAAKWCGRAPAICAHGVVGGEINIDFLVGAGVVHAVDTCSVTLGEFSRTGPNFARYVQAGRVKALDNT